MAASNTEAYGVTAKTGEQVVLVKLRAAEGGACLWRPTVVLTH
jgi:hypothetical protein